MTLRLCQISRFAKYHQTVIQVINKLGQALTRSIGGPRLLRAHVNRKAASRRARRVSSIPFCDSNAVTSRGRFVRLPLRTLVTASADRPTAVNSINIYAYSLASYSLRRAEVDGKSSVSTKVCA